MNCWPCAVRSVMGGEVGCLKDAAEIGPGCHQAPGSFHQPAANKCMSSVAPVAVVTVNATRQADIDAPTSALAHDS